MIFYQNLLGDEFSLKKFPDKNLLKKTFDDLWVDLERQKQLQSFSTSSYTFHVNREAAVLWTTRVDPLNDPY